MTTFTSPARTLATAALALLIPLFCRAATPADVDPATLERIRATALSSDWAWQRLAALTDTIGPRSCGSPQYAAAATQVADALRALGAQVTLQPARVPHWVRGAELGELVDYPGRPAGLTQQVKITALGGSAATPNGGLTARVVVIRDRAELKARAAEIRGSIVLFVPHFDRQLAANGYAGDAYAQSVGYRRAAPSEVAALGAVAALVRSIGGAEYRLPHTGTTGWKPGQAAIPAAALAAEDADLIARLNAAGPVSMQLTLTPQTLPDADSANVIADWRGSERPDEIVVVSGHLDSWDLGTGAIDDGFGVMSAAGVIQVLQQLHLRPRRTIRFIGWSCEERGAFGAKVYFDSLGPSLAAHVAAIESDFGSGAALGINAAIADSSAASLEPVLGALAPLGATKLALQKSEQGSDIALLQQAGVPGFSPIADSRLYFDYHHTAADTLDKISPQDLKSHVATLAVLAYHLAQMPEPLARFAIP
jgi:carboxypeptidase Q